MSETAVVRDPQRRVTGEIETTGIDPIPDDQRTMTSFANDVPMLLIGGLVSFVLYGDWLLLIGGRRRDRSIELGS